MSHIIGIILAAGMSKRMRRNKLLLPFHGMPMLQHVINAAKTSQLAQVLIIIPDEIDKETQNYTQDMLTALDTSQCTILRNSLRHLGQAESLKVGVEYACKLNAQNTLKIQGAMVLLGDQPFLTANILDQLIDKALAHPQTWVIPHRITAAKNSEERGNPVIIPSNEFSRVLQIQGDSGARVLIDNSRYPRQFVEINDTAPFIDIDTPEMYAKLTSKGNI